MVSRSIGFVGLKLNLVDCPGELDFSIKTLSFLNRFIPPFNGLVGGVCQPEISSNQSVGFRSPDGRSFSKIVDALPSRFGSGLFVLFKFDHPVERPAIFKPDSEVAQPAI